MTGSTTPPNKPNQAQKAAAQKTPNKKKNILTLCIIAGILVAALLGGLIWFLTLTADNGLIFDNVYAGDVNLGGMTPEEATNVLHMSTDNTYSKQDMVIVLPNGELRLSPADTGASLNVEAVVEEAYSYGREGSRYEQYKARQAAVLSSHTLDLIPHLNLNTEQIRSAINEAAIPYNTTLTQPTVTVTGDRPALEKDKMDPEAPAQVMTLTIGIPESSLDAAALFGLVLNAYSSNTFMVTPEVPITQPEAVDLEAIFTEHCVEPIDALLNEEDYTVAPEVYGYGFDIALVQELVDAAEPGQTLEIEFGYLEPELTKEAIESTLFQDVLATYKAYQSSSANRSTNLRLAAAAINGYILKPGETFSFNGVVGKRTEEKGYKPAGAYFNGETVDEVGGGICQVSSSLYYCALLADLEIVSRTCHMYPSSYVPIGLDATVSWGYLDFKFKNNTDYPIRIEASGGSGTVTVTFYGTDDKDYYIKLDSATLETYKPETEYKTFAYDNEEGYKDGDVIQTAHTGYKAVSYRIKYSKADDSLISKDVEAYSSYRKTNKIVAKVEAPPPPPTEPPVTTLPEETEPSLEGEVDSGGIG